MGVKGCLLKDSESAHMRVQTQRHARSRVSLARWRRRKPGICWRGALWRLWACPRAPGVWGSCTLARVVTLKTIGKFELWSSERGGWKRCHWFDSRANLSEVESDSVWRRWGALGHMKVCVNLNKATKTGTYSYCGLQFRRYHRQSELCTLGLWILWTYIKHYSLLI